MKRDRKLQKKMDSISFKSTQKTIIRWKQPSKPSHSLCLSKFKMALSPSIKALESKQVIKKN